MAGAMPQSEEHDIAQSKRRTVETDRHLLTLPWPCAPRGKGPAGGWLSPPLVWLSPSSQGGGEVYYMRMELSNL